MKAIIAAAIIFCAALIGVTYYFATRPDTSPRTVPIDASYTARVQAKGWVMGSTTPKVEVVEFGDLQCPSCAAAYPVISGAISQTTDVAQFTYHHFPLTSIHDKALLADKIAEAAGRQGKFWEMQGALFTNQPTWESMSSADFQNAAEGYAKGMGLDINQLRRDIKDSTIVDPITADIQQGNDANVQHTPTLLINGTEVQSIPTTAEDLAALIRSSVK